MTKNLVDTNSVQTLENKSVTATGSTTARLLADWMADCINVAGYPATQAGYAEAVSDAYAAGKTVYWPAGTYVSTATLPNFHDVRHRGPGIVQRGSDLFYPDPSLHPGVTNILYIATTGSDTNDGLSSSEPRLTTQATGNLLYTYAYGDVTWKIQYAAGTYTQSVSFSKPFPTPRQVQFLGVALSDGVVPTTIFDSPTGAGKLGLYFQNYVRAYVEDIKFTNYKDGGAVSGSGGSAGLVADEFTDLSTRNVHVATCDVGVYLATSSRLRKQAGIVASCGVGVKAISCCTYTLGYNGSAADITGATGTAILTCTNGLLVQEMSTGHADYCYFGTNPNGIVLTVLSRCHAVSTTFISNTEAVQANFNSMLSDTTCTWTSNTTDVRLLSGSQRLNAAGLYDDRLGLGNGLWYRDTGEYTTQLATPTTIFTKSLAAKELENRGAGFKLRVHGEVTGTANTKTVVVKIGAVTLLSRAITATTLEYSIEVDFFCRTAANNATCISRVYENGVAPIVAITRPTTVDLTTQLDITVTHEVTNTGDTNKIQMVDLEITH